MRRTVGRKPFPAQPRVFLLSLIWAETANWTIITGSTCYSVHAWRHDGNRVKNFPIENIGMQYYSPAIADLDDNGRLEIVFCNISTKVHVFELPFSYR